MSTTALQERGGRPDAGQQTISLLLADDHPLMLAGVRRAMENSDGVEVVGEAHSGSQLLEMIERRRPDTVLMDMHMPGMDGAAVIAEICDRWPDVKVVVFSASQDQRQIDAALNAGASAYVVKSARPADVAAVLRQVVNGVVFVAPTGGAPTRSSARADVPILTERERTVLAAVAAGKTSAQISQELWISEHTTKFHLTRIYRKLGVPNRAAAVRYAIEAGIA
jgi:DNA-binding NarL/FixJ family response regulator